MPNRAHPLQKESVMKNHSIQAFKSKTVELSLNVLCPECSTQVRHYKDEALGEYYECEDRHRIVIDVMNGTHTGDKVRISIKAWL